MVRRTFKGLVQLLGGLGAGVAIIVLLVAWQLHKGPVSLGFLTPYVEQALNANHRAFQLAIDDTTLTWAGWDRAVELRVKNVRAIGESGEAVARIPELSMSLSGRALLHGQLAPKFIEFLGPELRVRRAAHGDFDIELATQSESPDSRIAAGLIGWLLKRPEPGTPMSYLDTVSVSGATMTFEDEVSGRRWQVPVGYARLDRAAHGLIANGSVLIDIDGKIADVTLNGSYQADGERLDLTASFTDIAPAAFAGLDKELESLSAVDVPLSGNLLVGMTMGGGVDTVGFNVKGGAGKLLLPEPLFETFTVDSLSFRGLYSKGTDRLTVDAFDIVAAKDVTLSLPAPVLHTFPIKSIKGALKYDFTDLKLDVSELAVDTGGPVLTLSANAVGLGGDAPATVNASAALSAVLFDEVKTYWPQNLGSDAYAWVTEHMSVGVMSGSTAEVALKVNPDFSAELISVTGTMRVEDVNVWYLEGMPAVTDGYASITFDADVFDIAVERAKSGDIDVVGGTVHLSGLSDVDQYADIQARVEAELPSLLALIDNKPLGFASAMGIKPAKTKGRAEVDLSMRFILEKDIGLDDVDVSAEAEMRDVAMDDVVLGRGIEGGKLQLKADKKGMNLYGDVRMGTIPVALTWHENFTDGAPYTARYEMSAPIDKIDNVADLGVHAPEIAKNAMSGGVDAKLIYTVFDRRTSRLEVSTNLARAEINVPELDWRKAPGDPGHANVTILIENGLVKRVPSFEVEARDLFVRGDITYSSGGLGLERVNLNRVLFGRSDASGAVIARADGTWEVGLQGKVLDLTPIWHHIVGDAPENENKSLPNITLALEVGKVFVDKERFMTNLSATLVHRDDIWRTVLIDSKLNGENPFNVRMTPDGAGSRVVSVKADNAGETLRFLDLFENMYGGTLEIRGTYDDALPARPLKGEMRVANYRIRNAPLLTRILSIMSLTGIVDAMTGEGLSFGALEVPFTKTAGEIVIADAKATGTSIGFTASGSVYTQADVVNLEGTVVPAYAINSFLGKIPLLGNLLAGSESGGGVFAANFAVSGPIEDPKTTVNPLSALTPGILRNLFGAFKSDEPTLLDVPDDQLPGLLGN